MYWLNTYFFYVGLHRDCPDLLNQIIAFPVTTEGERWLKILNMGNYFLAGYASPYSVVKNNLAALFIEAAKLYQDVRAGRTDTKLGEVTELTLLWFVQMLLRQSHGFEFFRKAIEDSIPEIDCSMETEETKLYALFLFGLVGVEIDESAPLDYLVKQYGVERLPLPISLGITLETEVRESTGHSQLMKKHSKKLRKLLKGNHQLGAIVKGIVHKPIKDRSDLMPKPASK